MNLSSNWQYFYVLFQFLAVLMPIQAINQIIENWNTLNVQRESYNIRYKLFHSTYGILFTKFLCFISIFGCFCIHLEISTTFFICRKNRYYMKMIFAKDDILINLLAFWTANEYAIIDAQIDRYLKHMLKFKPHFFKIKAHTKKIFHQNIQEYDTQNML